MFRDIELSRGLLATFLARPETKTVLEDSPATSAVPAAAVLDFGVSVITTGLWPTQPPSPDGLVQPVLPKQLQELFSGFYAARFKGRSLRWSPLLGQCTLRASY